MQDMELAWGRLDWHHVLANSIARPPSSLIPHRSADGQQSIILDYYIHFIAPMCSTTHLDNGFTQQMLPIALLTNNAPDDALLNSMLSISAHHRWGPQEAYAFKGKALQSLRKSLASASCYGGIGNTVAQFAAAMMMCMYSVFDADEGCFYVHLKGARDLLLSSNQEYGQSQATDFLVMWLLYYDVLGDFAHPLQRKEDVYGALVVDQIQRQSDTTLIIGLLGCSFEVFEVIRRTNMLRSSILRGHGSTTAVMVEQRGDLERTLFCTSQRINDGELLHATEERYASILSTAELYRLASLLYLQRVVPLEGDKDRRETYLEQALAILSDAKKVSSPWPCFIIACEVTMEDQRSQILGILDTMDTTRKIGNVHVTRVIIETIWKQKDLRGPSESFGWWSCPDFGLSVPWFA
uniref:Zn(II)2Cys6 transcription factor n=1 Tax=Bionectria ochroleuca TaxID=29856 RepID=A0A8H7K5J7_BIOOC